MSPHPCDQSLQRAHRAVGYWQGLCQAGFSLFHHLPCESCPRRVIMLRSQHAAGSGRMTPTAHKVEEAGFSCGVEVSSKEWCGLPGQVLAGRETMSFRL